MNPIKHPNRGVAYLTTIAAFVMIYRSAEGRCLSLYGGLSDELRDLSVTKRGFYTTCYFLLMFFSSISLSGQSIVLSKTTTNATPDVEEVFNYTLDLSCSSSTGPCQGVVIRDTIPGYLEFLNFSNPLPSGVASATYDASTREAVITFENNVSAGSSIQLNIQVQFPFGTLTGSSAVNTAYATSINAGSDFSSATGTAQNGMTVGDFPDFKWGDGDMISGGYQYWSIEVGNIGFSDIDNYTIIDTIPTGIIIDQVRSPHFTNVDHSGDMFYMASNNPGVWVPWFNFNMDTRERHYVSGLSLSPGVIITQLKLELGTVSANGLFNPYIYPNTFERNWTIYGIEDGSHNVGDTYTNCANYTGNSGGSFISDVSCRTTNLIAPTNEITGGVDALNSSGVTQSTYSIGDTMIVALEYASPTLMGNNLVGGVMTAILPPNVNYVPGSWFYEWGAASTDGHSPAVETDVTFDGREIVRFVYDSTVYNNAFSIEPTGGWDGFRLDFRAFVDPAALEGSYDIEYYFNATEIIPDNCGTNDVDSYLNGFASTYCDDDVSMNIVRPPGSAGLESKMEVIGTLDTDYSQYPDRALTVPGGISDYKITIKNPNADEIDQLVFITVLPHLFDTEVLDETTQRYSEWQPTLAEAVITGIPQLDVEYTTVSNPCRDDLAGSNPTPFPTGCITANWSATPPADITDVTALRFDYGNRRLAQNDSLVVSFSMRSPVDALPDTSIAWNSFAYAARNWEDFTDLLPAEPIKVGIELRPGNTPIVGDFVWEDTEPNGRQDIGEVGIDGVRVELYHDVNNNGVAEPSGPDTLELWTVTSAGGKYLFSDFDYGRYFIVFSELPSGYIPTYQDAAPDTLDSDGLISSVMLFDNTIIDYSHDLGLYNGVLPPLVEDCTNGIDDDGDGLIDCDDPDCGVTTIEYYNYQKAFAVVGQDDFVSSSGGTASDRLRSVRDVIVDPATNKVFVADGGNNRVLRYASFDDFLNNQNAEAVLGQSDFISLTPGTSASTMNNPNGLAIAQNGDLFVAEYYNNRVLKFANAATIPTGSSADVVLGQPDFITGTNGLTQTKMYRPHEILLEDDNTLWVADGWNGRVLRFDNATTLSNSAPADQVLGQTDYTSHVITVDSIHIDQTTGLAMVDDILFVGDYQANRVLIWEKARHKTNGAPADRVLGQPDFITDSSPIDERHVGGITDLDIDPSNNLFVQDIWQDRTTIFYDAPNVMTYDSAKVVLHQPDFNTILGGFSVNQRKSNSPNGIRYTRQGYVNYLIEGEQGGNRVLITRPAIETDEITAVTDTLPGRDLSGQNSEIFSIVTQPTDGIVVLDDASTGQFTYNPPGRCPIDVDTSFTFLYSITNIYGCIDTAEMLIFVDDVGPCFDISGSIFEDINYGGGNGRSYTAADASAQSSGWAADDITIENVTVELYDNVGSYVMSTLSNALGLYTFDDIVPASYSVRVVNNSIGSNRGSNSTGQSIVPVQTYRHNGNIAFANEVGGSDPTKVDAAANTTSANLSTLNTATTVAQSISNVTVSTADVSDIDFGYNFDVIVNENNDGQGSLRQFIINSNELDNSNLNQEDNPTSGVSFTKPAGTEHSIFMIAGSGAHTITPTSVLPALSDDYTHLTGYTQDGSSQGVIGSRTNTIELSGNSVLFDGLSINANNITISGLVVNEFRSGITGNAARNNSFIWGNYIGTSTDGLLGLGNSSVGIDLQNFTSSFIGTNGDNVNDANEGNLVSDNSQGIQLRNASSILIAGNIIGLNSNGNVAMANSFNGIYIRDATGANIIGYDDNAISNTAAHFRNVSSGNGNDGVRLFNASNQTISGNYFGTDVTGTTGIANGNYGVQLSGADSNNVIGTDSDGNDDVLERNIISGNGSGIRLASSGSGWDNVIAGNFIGTDVTGNTALGNLNNGIEINGLFTNTTVGTDGDNVRDVVERNIISGNIDDGIRLAATTGNVIAGNYIGVGVDGSTSLGNGNRGILIATTANNNIIGYSPSMANSDELIVGNRIVNNNDAGIGISGTGTQNRISRNQISDNLALGIDLGYDAVTSNDNGDSDIGANNLYNFPVITSTSLLNNNLTISGFAPPGSNIEFFVADAGPNPSPLPLGYDTSFGEGSRYLFTVQEGGAQDVIATTGVYNNDGTGVLANRTQSRFNFIIDVTGLGINAGTFLTATATDLNNNTSEFSGITEVILNCGTALTNPHVMYFGRN